MTVIPMMKASQVTTVLLDKYVDKRQQEGAANGTINRELAALKRMFDLGHEATPPKIFFIPHLQSCQKQCRHGFLEDAQYQRFLESCPEMWFRERYQDWPQKTQTDSAIFRNVRNS